MWSCVSRDRRFDLVHLPIGLVKLVMVTDSVFMELVDYLVFGCIVWHFYFGSVITDFARNYIYGFHGVLANRLNLPYTPPVGGG